MKWVRTLKKTRLMKTSMVMASTIPSISMMMQMEYTIGSISMTITTVFGITSIWILTMTSMRMPTSIFHKGHHSSPEQTVLIMTMMVTMLMLTMTASSKLFGIAAKWPKVTRIHVTMTSTMIMTESRMQKITTMIIMALMIGHRNYYQAVSVVKSNRHGIMTTTISLTGQMTIGMLTAWLTMLNY